MEYAKIEIVTTIGKMAALQERLSRLGVSGMTVYQVIGSGTQRGAAEYEDEIPAVNSLLPKELVMAVVPADMVDKVVEAVKKELYTGHIGDGKIFISPVTNVIRVRTGEEGADALS